MPHCRPARRRLAVLAAVAVAAPLALAGTAVAAPDITLRDVREFACPPGQVPSRGFTDTAGTLFALEIDCIAGYGVTLGTGGGTAFDPNGTVTRAQMAVFLSRVAGYAELRLDTDDAGFDDLVGLSEEASDAINAMANLDVAQGRTATVFDPAGPVQRDQMASFIVRLQEQVGAGFTVTDDFFTDDADNRHEQNIDLLAAAGVVQGTSEGTYSPGRSVTRQQMAAFLARYLDGRVEFGEVDREYPRDNDVLDVSPASETTTTAGERTYTASGLANGVEYRITLVQPATIGTGADGTLRFTDSDGDRLAEVGTYDADLTEVNGEPVEPTDGGPEEPSTATTQPDDDGAIVFTVAGEQDGDAVRPVIYPNTGRSPRLELAGDLRPVEVFGVGGTVTFAAAPAQTKENAAPATVGRVTSVDEEKSRFTLETPDGFALYTYDDSDDFRVEGQLQSEGEFADVLTRGDEVSIGRYFSDEARRSEFDITEDTPFAPAAVSAEKGTTPQTSGTITVTVLPGEPAELGLYDGFVIQRAPVTGASNGDEQTTGTVGEFETIDTPGDDADTQTDGFQYVDRDVESGSYRYRAAGVVDGQQSEFEVDPRNETSARPSNPDRVRPTSDDARIAQDFGMARVADTGDQLTVVFDEAMAGPQGGAFVQVTDAEGQSATLRNSGGATFRVEDRTLTIDLDEPGVRAGFYPLTITAAGGITDRSGNNWDVAESGATEFDVE